MKAYPVPIGVPTPAAQGALEVVRRLQRAGFTAYWAGGCVRDLIMGRPAKDYDIATNAVPDRVLDLFDRAVAVGKSFGVVRVPLGDDWYEVATFRKDEPYVDGRHPSAVTFSDPETDASRRDFTVNALFYDPVLQEALDYVGGYEDIGRRVIRAVGDPRARLEEDRLRLLRAVRFAATLDFTLEPATAEAIRATAPLIPTISAERIRDELSRTLTEACRAGDAVVLLHECGLLKPLLPEVDAMIGTEQPPEYHPEGDVFRHTVLMLNLMKTRDARLAWAVLLHDVGKPPTAEIKEGIWRFERHAHVGAEATRAILARFKFSNDDIDAIAFMVGNHMRFIDVKSMRRATLRKLAGAPNFAAEMELHRLDCLASHGDLENYDYLIEFRRRMDAEPVLPPPWIDGWDLMELGVPKGREVGVWRQKAYDAQLEGTFPDRASLLEWLRSEIGRQA